MYYGIDTNGCRVHINDSVQNMTYVCPACHGELVRKMGNIKIHHFAHRHAECDPWYHDNKGEWHRCMQNMFPAQYQEVRLEIDGEVHIADVCLPRPDGSKLIIEFQHSPMSQEEYEERNDFYSYFGEIIWVFDISDKRVVKISEEHLYRWYHPFSTLGSYRTGENHVFFYVSPMVNTKRWTSFFIHDDDNDCNPLLGPIADTAWKIAKQRSLLKKYGLQVHYSFINGYKVADFPCAYSLLYSKTAQTKEQLRDWILTYAANIVITQDDMKTYEEYITENQYDADVWCRFSSFTAYQKYFAERQKFNQYGTRKPHTFPVHVHYYLADSHRIKTITVYEDLCLHARCFLISGLPDSDVKLVPHKSASPELTSILQNYHTA